MAIFLYLAGAVVELITRGVVREHFGEGRRRKAIGQLRDHTIICGFGRVGRSVAAEFDHAGREYVVIDVNPASIAAAVEFGALVVHGDGTEDAHLEAAGLAHARALVASADSDEKNLFITLSARAARPDIFIVARASDDSAARKLRLAGADRVVAAVLVGGPQDREPRAQAAGRRLSRHRLDRRRGRAPLRGDHGRRRRVLRPVARSAISGSARRRAR